MKKIMLLTAVIISTLCCTAQSSCDKKSIAEVNQVQGVFIFIGAKPLQEYDYIGSIKVKVCWECRPEEMINITLKKLKKDFPTAEGLLFTSADMDRADVIKFKTPGNSPVKK